MMAEQREPGWFWVRLKVPDKWGFGLWCGNDWQGSHAGNVAEIGERIPSNKELKALWAVAEAARYLIDHAGIKHPYSDVLICDRKQADILIAALARLGEQKMSGPEPEP